MTPEDFLKNARDPNEWCAKAKALRLSADAVWEGFLKRLMLSANKETRTLPEQREHWLEIHKFESPYRQNYQPPHRLPAGTEAL